MRVAVEPGSGKALLLLRQPRFQAGHLAFPVARHTAYLAGVTAIAHFRLHCDQVLHPQAFGNGAGDKTVGGGNDHQRIATLTVVGQQRLAPGQDMRLDDLGHKLSVPGGQLFGAVRRQRFKGHGEKRHDIQRAGLVVGHEAVVGGAIGLGIHGALLQQKLTPSVITVDGEQGVVQIKDGQTHGVPLGYGRESCRLWQRMPPQGSPGRACSISKRVDALHALVEECS